MSRSGVIVCARTSRPRANTAVVNTVREFMFRPPHFQLELGQFQWIIVPPLFLVMPTSFLQPSMLETR
jgi:hypothetical protein